MGGYEIVASGAGQDYDWQADHIFVKATMQATGGRVTVVEDTLKAGFHLPRHFHKRMTEVFYVLEGHVTFAFDDATTVATPGATVTILPGTWHDVTCPDGGRLITIFAPGGFEDYLAELARLSADELADEERLRALAETYDTWTE